FGADQALAIFAAGLVDLGDAVEHQHRRQRQLCIAGAEHLAAAAGQQVLVLVAVLPLVHSVLFLVPTGAPARRLVPPHPLRRKRQRIQASNITREAVRQGGFALSNMARAPVKALPSSRPVLRFRLAGGSLSEPAWPATLRLAIAAPPR